MGEARSRTAVYWEAGQPPMPIRQTTVESGGAPLPDEVKAELENILASAAFRRSERHAQFLRYVCQAALNGESSKLNEYLIAHEVFGRGDDYSPSEDSVVRRQAHSLRQKLQDYYNGGGKENPLRIALPIGRYVPIFVRPPHPQPVVESPLLPRQLKKQAARSPQWWLGLVVGAGIVLFALGWLLAGWTHGREPGHSLDPALTEVWGPWLSSPDGAVICFSNPMTAVVKQFSTRLPAGSQPPRLAVTAEQDQKFRKALNLPPGGFLYLSPAISQSKTGEALGGIAMATFFTKLGVPVHATQSRFLSWEDFRTHNLILLGHDEANRWLDPILSKLPIRLAVTEGDHPRRIVNMNPEKGQASEYRLSYTASKDQPSQDYGLVSMIGGTDGRHQLLLINGLNTEGTEAAMEYLTDPASLQNVFSSLRRTAPKHTGRWQFQLVLRTEVRDKVPTRADLIVVKVL